MWNEELQFFSGYQLEGKKQLKQVKVLCKKFIRHIQQSESGKFHQKKLSVLLFLVKS